MSRELEIDHDYIEAALDKVRALKRVAKHLEENVKGDNLYEKVKACTHIEMINEAFSFITKSSLHATRFGVHIGQDELPDYDESHGGWKTGQPSWVFEYEGRK